MCLAHRQDVAVAGDLLDHLVATANLSAGLAHASAQANGREPARHGEAHSSAGERHGGRASGGRGRQGNEQDQGTAEERRRGDDSKMSNEPVERELTERARVCLDALAKANAAPRSKRTGKPCRGAAMPNGRCKLHGGKSTGPRTPEESGGLALLSFALNHEYLPPSERCSGCESRSFDPIFLKRPVG